MIRLNITVKYCIAFYSMVMLYSSLHELIHHFSGYLICGQLGVKTFNYFKTTCKSEIGWYATYAGPVFSFAMMYVGMWFLKQPVAYKKHLGFALIFAQMPVQRMVMPIAKMNDEYLATAMLFGRTEINYWLTINVVWLICLPPLIKAFSVIENRNRIIWFLFYLLLFPYLLWGPPFVLLEYLMVNRGFLAHQVIGIGLLFIINEILTIILFYFTRKYINPEDSSSGGIRPILP